MKPTPEETDALAKKIAEIEERLQNMEEEIEDIGEPAAQHLKRRLEALKIEESALKRNLAEALDMEEPDERRMAKIQALLEYIQGEEAEVEHEAEFLHQSPPSSMELAAESARLVAACAAFRKAYAKH